MRNHSYPFVLILFAGLILLAGCRKKEPAAGDPDAPDAPTPRGTGAPGPAPVDNSPPIVVAADQFSKEMEAGDMSKYAGKRVELTGKVYGTLPDAKSAIAYFQSAPKANGTTSNYNIILPLADADRVENLAREQEITVRGRVWMPPMPSNLTPQAKAAWRPFTYEIREAELVSVGPDTGVRKTAAEWAKEFAANPTGTFGRYINKTVFIEGVVLDTQSVAQPPGVAVTVAGPNANDVKDDKLMKVRVVVMLQSDQAKQRTAALKPGQTIRAKGSLVAEAGNPQRNIPAKLEVISAFLLK